MQQNLKRSTVDIMPPETKSPEDEVHSEVAQKAVRDSHGRFVTGQNSDAKTPLVSINSEKPTSKNDIPPLVNLQIANPITYLKLWWKKVMGQEGIDVHFRIHPITAIILTGMIATGSFAIGRLTLPAPIVQFIPQLAPPPSPSPWREAAYTGTFKQINSKYILSTGEGESVILDVPATVNIPKILNKRILAIGQYNTQTKILKVTEATDMEVLPTQTYPVPTTTPAPSL